MSQEKCTINSAAKALGVTTKTIYRYLSNGTLSKIREGSRTYILIDEVRKLRSNMSETVKNDVLTDMGHSDTEKITISLKQYTDLIDELGQYKNQVSGQAKYLLEYKEDLQTKDKELEAVKSALAANNAELIEAKETINKARGELKRLFDTQRELKDLRAEIERLRLPWWRRIWRGKDG